MVTEAQFGQEKLTASSPGNMFLEQQEHLGILMASCELNPPHLARFPKRRSSSLAKPLYANRAWRPLLGAIEY
jgi:hypothetical protein